MGAPGPRSQGRSRRPVHVDRRVVLAARRRQGRPGRPQRRRQDLAAEGALRRGAGAAGVVARSGASGTCRRTRRRAAPGSTAPRSPTCCRPRSRPARRRLDELAPRMADDASPRNVRGTATPRTRSATPAATPPTPRSAASRPGSGSRADRLDLPITALSGGERRRVELTRILFAGSDLLLLDEPTNHLDIDAKQWLMQFLRTYRGALLVISHDLELLDQAITRVLAPRRGRAHRVPRHVLAVSRRAAGRRRAPRPSSRRARRARSTASRRSPTRCAHQTAEAGAHREDARPPRREARRATRSTAAKAERTLRVRAARAAARGRVALEVVDLAKAFGPKIVFEDVTFDVGRGERMLVLGLNGAGKTTLLRTLVGELEADLGDGAARPPGLARLLRAGARGHHARAATCSSTCATAAPSPTSTSAAARHVRPARRARRSRTRARSRAARRPSSRSRCSSPGTHNLLLLDEPTNNLDPPSRAAIGAALRDVEGRDGAREPRHRIRDRARARPGARHARRRRSTTGPTTSSTSSSSA